MSSKSVTPGVSIFPLYKREIKSPLSVLLSCAPAKIKDFDVGFGEIENVSDTTLLKSIST